VNPNEHSDRELILRRRPAEIRPMQGYVAAQPIMPLPAPPPESGGLLDYIRVFRRNAGLIFGVALGAALLGYISTLPQKPVYRAKTTMEIQSPNENFLNVKDLDPGTTDAVSDSYVETATRILKDDTLLERTALRLGVQFRPEQLGPSTRFREWAAQVGLGRWVKPHTPSRDEAIARIRENLSINNAPQSHLVEIQYDSIDPKFAAEFANGLASESIEQNLDARWEAAQKTAEWLAKPIAELKANLAHSAAALQNYAGNAGLILNDDKGSTAAEEKFRQIQQDLSSAQADRALKQSKYEIAQAAPLESLPDVVDQGTLRDAQGRLTELKRQEAELAATFTPTYFKLKNVRAQIAQLDTIVHRERTSVLERIQNDYQSAARREKLVQIDYQEQAKLVSQQAAKAIQYETLKRELETNRTLYEAMLEKVKEAGIVSTIRASNIRIISLARVPSSPVKPMPLFNAAAGFLAGLFLCTAFVLIRDQTDRRIRAPGEAASYLNLLELGTIPSRKLERRIPERTRVVVKLEGRATRDASGLRAWQWVRRKPVRLADWGDEGSILAESFRSTLASLWFAGKRGKQLRVFVVSSPAAHEGKTTMTTNLGIALANTNRRVLLVDGDLRRPQLHKVFDLDNGFGLANILEGERPVEDYLFAELFQPTSIEGLFVLTSGVGAANIASLRYQDRLTDLLLRFRLEFHAVLIDSPPALELSDARILGGLSDGVILVFRAGKTSRDVAAATLRRFHEDGIPVLGSVLNDWNPKDAPYGYANAYASYRYSYGGASRTE
jgi:succinoglycan biosynthesis transport protein ExoP